MENSISTIARSAAKWWADQLRTPTAQLWQDGDDLRRFWLDALPRSQNDNCAIQLFQDSLQEIILSNLFRRNEIVLDVGYHPDYFLMTAINSAGVSVTGIDLPLKTKMLVSPSSIIVIFNSKKLIDVPITND